MCYNCGNILLNNPIGVGYEGVEPEGKLITTKTFEEAAKSQGITTLQAQEETYKLLQKTLVKN